MKIAIYSDIHSNLQALEVVMMDIKSQGADVMCCLGDIVGYGANPAECLEIVKKSRSIILRGNHDQAAAKTEDLYLFNEDARRSLIYSSRALSKQQRSFLSLLPLTHDEHGIEFVHATLNFPDLFHYANTERDVERHFKFQKGSLCFCGHTHVPGIWLKETSEFFFESELTLMKKETYLINVGSVGQPRDFNTRACYVLYDTDKATIRFRRLAYDVQAARRAILDAHLPSVLAERLVSGV